MLVSSDDEAAAEHAIAWAAQAFAHIARQAGRRPARQPERTEPEPGEAPLCAVHQMPMIWMQTKRGSFWSCHQKNLDGTWCDYRPEREGNGE